MSEILSEAFLSKYKELENTPLSAIGEFVYLRTYSRYLDDKKRRENWFETVLRTTKYNIELGIDFKKKHGFHINLQDEIKEAELLFDNLFNLRTFTSGRTLYMGGTDIVKEYPLSNYNCSFTMIEEFHDFVDIFYLLMVGSGVGVRIDKELIIKMPKIRKISVAGEYSEGVHKYMPKEYMEDTKLILDKDEPSTATIKIGDSKEGWCNALETYFKLVTLPEYINIKKVVFDYSYVRPEGERLKRFGGRASGHKSLKRMFEKINKVCSNLIDGSLKSIDVLDIATIISENVVSGGVRRSAMMIICDEDDKDVINAKSNLYKIVSGNWIENLEVSHRKMSNNSVLYKERPSLDKIKQILNSIKINGEPGFINGAEAKKRKRTFKGCNPCGEILLNSHQCCNLSTNNLVSFVDKDNELDVKHLEEVLKLSTRVAIRMTLVNVELPNWNEVMQSDRIVGISLTGMMDMLNKTNMDYNSLGKLLKHLREVVRNEGTRYSNELGISAPELMTTIKPEGSLSTLPCVSSGIHYSHSNYYIRRVRISVSDPLYKMIEKLKCYPIFNENGQNDENCTTKVIEFPIKAPEGKTKYDVGAIEQLELYKLSMMNWTDHNTSITVHVKDDEWDDVADWLYNNFDYVVGITFLPLMDETYPLLPYESISREEYEKRLKNIKPIDYELLAELDDDEEHEIIDKECANGVCPVR
ncbi:MULTISPECIES: ribonucleoside-triphosphate reductase, adenosylcobalamin-dependent [unclassified Clostridium]|uniref:ribonucleoside-triphosphate reductase, adenosylcobalamin-dependent n=1 Tax=unclassified Clostridium TaxID=2614128 RepID=UPI00029798E5|nr:MULTISPECIES: ribonucleoside-triphosphate reductase, adenosylcobalamin-dependent [unclassified Clostridium]EKQ56780.1 MAG: ribonucleoside-triphosphate reductase, adenosylcobalamin-dependent [Clostridium sp. Maddingley MBC34-26]